MCDGKVRYGTASTWTQNEPVSGSIQCSHKTIDPGRFDTALGVWWGGIVGWVSPECHCYGTGLEVKHSGETSPTTSATTTRVATTSVSRTPDPDNCQHRPMGLCSDRPGKGHNNRTGVEECCSGLTCTPGIIPGVSVCTVRHLCRTFEATCSVL